MVNDLPDMHEIDIVCEVCQLGKQTRLSFPKNEAWRTWEVCDLMNTCSLNDNKYFVFFIDDYNRMC